MRARIAAAAAAASAGLFSSVAGAQLVPEIERDGEAINNTPASAQLIAPSAFLPAASPSIFGTLPTASVRGRGGGDDIDFFAFQAGPGPAYFDIDSTATGFDTYVALFDSAGTLLGDGDDSFPADPGSLTDRDAFLGVFTLPRAGVYYAAVARSGNFATATFTGTMFNELVRPDGEFGGFQFLDATLGDPSFDRSGPQMGLDYTLHITIPAPGPAAAAALAIAAFGARRRRR